MCVSERGKEGEREREGVGERVQRAVYGSSIPASGIENKISRRDGMWGD